MFISGKLHILTVLSSWVSRNIIAIIMATKTVTFLINGVAYELSDLDEITYTSIMNDDQFAMSYINDLILNKTITIEGNINALMRVEGDKFIDIKNCDNGNATTLKQTDSEWGPVETKILLDKYELYLPQIGPMKKFKTKKIMWQEIANDISKITGITKSFLQCENRYKTIMKRKKKADINNHTSGSSRQVIEYEEEIRKIAAIDDSIEPQVLRGPGKILKKSSQIAAPIESGNEDTCEVLSENQIEHTRKKVRKVRSAGETLLEIQKMKEENKERRHKEKIELMKELISVLQNK